MSCNLLLIEDNEKSLVTDELIHFYLKNCIFSIPPPPGGTAILPEYIHYYG
jgi:hypothetical protein